MRIVVISSFYPFPPSVGGVKKITLDTAYELARRGHEVIIITSPFDNVTKEKITNDVIERKHRSIVTITLPPGLFRLGDPRGISGWRTLRYMDKILEAIDPDVIHVHNIHPTVAQVARYVRRVASRDLSRPVFVIEPHHPAISADSVLIRKILLPMAVLWIRKNQEILTSVIAHTSMEYKWWKFHGIQNVSIVRFPSVSRHLVEYRATGKNPYNSDNIIIFIGRIIPVKRLEILLYAVSVIKNKINDVKLLLVGPYELNYKKKLDVLINKLELEKNVVFTGVIYGNKKYEYISSSKVLALPSKKEYTPAVAVESQALGVPVVATRVGALDELVINGKTGFLIDPDDVKGFTKALLRILSDKNLQKEMSLNAKVNATRFLLEKSISELIKLYKGEYHDRYSH